MYIKIVQLNSNQYMLSKYNYNAKRIGANQLVTDYQKSMFKSNQELKGERW